MKLLARIAAERPLVTAMEPTGTYGDALRQALSDAGLRVDRVGAKACHVDWMDAQRRQYAMWLGRLEGLLSRHWPEATRWMELSWATHATFSHKEQAPLKNDC